MQNETAGGWIGLAGGCMIMWIMLSPTVDRLCKRAAVSIDDWLSDRRLRRQGQAT